MAAGDNGVSIVPEKAVRDEVRAGLLVTVELVIPRCGDLWAR
jgi:hypothetical protein